MYIYTYKCVNNLRGNGGTGEIGEKRRRGEDDVNNSTYA